jgi:DNA mismatch repair protein MutL
VLIVGYVVNVNGTMPLIQALSTEVVHLIAAGEVIDSLASVVRELAENAIDARATRINIEIATDPFTIAVSDNGVGMSLEDLARAATPHTTSKIESEADLQQINSLGFRGEALYSLAQLSNLQICSRSSIDTSGWQVNYDYAGNVSDPPKAIAIAPGTIVTASNIFSTRPSRLEILPALSQQLRKIQIVIHHMAIANPQITWQVSQNGRPWLNIWSSSDVRDILTQIVSSLQPTDLISGEINSELDRRSNYKTDGEIISAIANEVVRESAKAEIQITMGLPDRCHRRRLDWVKIIVNGRLVQLPEIEQTILSSFARTLPRQRFPVCVVHLSLPPSQVDWNRKPDKSEVYLLDLNCWQNLVGDLIGKLLQSPLQPSPLATAGLLRAAEAGGQYSVPSTPNSSLKALAQVHNTYILAEHPTGLWLVEQHVAHERVLFEQLENRWQIVPLEQPIILKDLLPEQVKRLEALGIDIAPFGEEMWAARSLPAILVTCPEYQDALLEISCQEDPQLARATVACRSATRNGTPLDLATMQNLLDRWQQTRNSHTCPHGRPICLALDSDRLARFFRRNWIIGK